MDVQLTVKGLLTLAREYYAEAEEAQRPAIQFGGDCYDTYLSLRGDANRCVDQALVMLGDVNLLPKDVLDQYLPF